MLLAVHEACLAIAVITAIGKLEAKWRAAGLSKSFPLVGVPHCIPLRLTKSVS